MTLFIISVVVVLAIWATCSLAEATMYSVRTAYIRQLIDSGVTAGRILDQFKENMEQPISAILIVNTAVSAGGAAIIGAHVRTLFGETALVWFAVIFTVAALFLSEIVPKIIGVAFNRQLARWLAAPLAGVITLLYPLVWLVQLATRTLMPRQAVLSAPEEEVAQFAAISAEEGSIMPYEAELVHNVLQLDRITARDIMTPRPVVTKLPAEFTLKETVEKMDEWTYSRIPIYAKDDPETWTGFVLSREVLAEVAHDRFDQTVNSLSKPLFFVSEMTPGHVLLKSFLKRRTHLFGVADEYGDITGIVTLEDVLESLIGEEIVDESDTSVDMQEVARLRKREQFDVRGVIRQSGDESQEDH